jgi:hypothetical protein
VPMIVSREGFTQKALEAAKAFGISTLSLLPSDGEPANFRVDFQSYVTIYQWTKYTILVVFAGKRRPSQFTPEQVQYKGKPVIEWFLKELFTTHRTRTETGHFGCHFSFDNRKMLEIAGERFFVKQVIFDAERDVVTRTKFIGWSGTAFYDWQSDCLNWPSNGCLVTDAISSDFSDWDICENVPGSQSGWITMNFRAFAAPPGYADKQVPDLPKLWKVKFED